MYILKSHIDHKNARRREILLIGCLLHNRLKETIHKDFSHRNYGSKFVVLGYNSKYFSNKIQKGKTCYFEEQVISMLEFLIGNSDSYEYKNKSARRGAQFVPIGMPTTCGNSIPPKETNMLSMRNSSILITCSSK
jgi:hypothetical protein